MATSYERRLSCRAAISAKFGSGLVLGAGCAHALSHLRWQVTALRLPCVRPSMGKGSGIGTWLSLGQPASRAHTKPEFTWRSSQTGHLDTKRS